MLKYMKKVYPSFVELGEELASASWSLNFFTVVSIQFERGPGSRMTLHILYRDTFQDTGEQVAISPWNRAVTIPR